MRRILGVVLILAGLVLVLRPGHGADPASTSPTAAGADVAPSVAVTVPALPPEPATVTVPSTSTTVAGATDIEPVDRLEREQPLVQDLPRTTSTYRIDYTVAPDRSLRLTITLFVELNDEADLERHDGALAAQKAEALEWLRAHGADPTALSIRWLPPEAGRL